MNKRLTAAAVSTVTAWAVGYSAEVGDDGLRMPDGNPPFSRHSRTALPVHALACQRATDSGISSG